MVDVKRHNENDETPSLRTDLQKSSRSAASDLLSSVDTGVLGLIKCMKDLLGDAGGPEMTRF